MNANARYLQSSKQITESRAARFAAFRESLDEAERTALDAKLERWADLLRDQRNDGGGFGRAAMIELYMALVEWTP